MPNHMENTNIKVIRSRFKYFLVFVDNSEYLHFVHIPKEGIGKKIFKSFIDKILQND